jgi:hypothetical protein
MTTSTPELPIILPLTGPVTTAAATTSWREVVRRPDGRPLYRASRAPHADVLTEEGGEPTSVIVWRTHDVDVATALATAAWAAADMALDGSLPGRVTLEWRRKVPASTTSEYAWIAWKQPAGVGSPAVLFSDPERGW